MHVAIFMEWVAGSSSLHGRCHKNYERKQQITGKRRVGRPRNEHWKQRRTTHQEEFTVNQLIS